MASNDVELSEMDSKPDRGGGGGGGGHEMGLVEMVSAGACACFCCIGVVVAFVLLVIVPWGVVDYHEYGLLYHKIGKKVVDKTPYEMGRYYIGVDHEFIKYNRTMHDVDFTSASQDFLYGGVETRVNDGQRITLECSFQYALRKEDVYDVYVNYLHDYDAGVRRTGQTVIRDVCAKYRSEDFFTHRAEIEDDIITHLGPALRARYVQLKGFQLRKINLPASFDARLLAIQMKGLEAREREQDIILQRIAVTTAAIVNVMTAEKENLSLELAKNTELMRTNISREVAKAHAVGKRTISSISVGISTHVALEQQITEVRRVEISANTTLTNAITAHKVREIQLEMLLTEARHNAEISITRAHAIADQYRATKAAEVESLRLVLQAERRHFNNLTSTLGLSVEEALHFKWVEMIAKHDPRHLLFDTSTPLDLMLAHQRELYINTLNGSFVYW